MPVTRSNKKKESFYAVAKGKRIGIYASWSEAEPLVRGFAGAKYKKFDSLQEARYFLGSGYENETVSVIDAMDERDGRQTGIKCGGDPAVSSAGKRDKTIDYSSSPSIASASNSREIDEKKNNRLESLSLAIMPNELRGETLQFFQDDCLLLCMTNSNLYQVHSFHPNKVHSWFTSDYIFSGKCNYFTKVDPLLISLRHLYRHTLTEAQPLCQIFCDIPLLNCPAIQSINWSPICDVKAGENPAAVKEECKLQIKSLRYQINVERSIHYLLSKVNKVSSLIKSAKINSTDASESDLLALQQLLPFLPRPLYTELMKRVSP